MRLLNDLEAVAHALPHLLPGAVDWSGDEHGPSANPRRLLAVNIGTGFGSACLIRTDAGWISCPSESGHMRLGAFDTADLELFAALDLIDPTVEDVLSGAGLRRLVRHFGTRDAAQTNVGQSGAGQTNVGQSGAATDGPVSPPDLTSLDPAATRALTCMTRVLADTSANLVLAHAAWDGLYLCGSVATAWWDNADLGAFRCRFDGGSALHDVLARTPIGLIRSPFPAFIGLANLGRPSDPA